jgi:hypothetical protein
MRQPVTVFSCPEDVVVEVELEVVVVVVVCPDRLSCCGCCATANPARNMADTVRVVIVLIFVGYLPASPVANAAPFLGDSRSQEDIAGLRVSREILTV